MDNHHISIDNQERMTITQVADVDAFDEETLWVNLKEGSLEVTGQKLNIEKLDLEQGLLVLTGEIGALAYTERRSREKKRLFGRAERK